MKNFKSKVNKLKLKKGDAVKVTLGKDKGKTGKIEKVLAKKNSVLVTGINMYKKHLKSRGEGKPGGIIDINKPILIAKVVVICPKCSQQTRLGYSRDESGEKYRICKKCKAII